MSTDPKVSIIITTKNSGIDLNVTMESLKISQHELSYEVIIVDEGSIDGCCDFLLHYRFKHSIRKLKGQLGQSSRNIAASQAKGQYLIFCSSRLYFADYWMEELLEPIIQGVADAVSPSFSIEEKRPGKKEVRHKTGILHTIQSYPWTQAGAGLPWLWAECFAVSRDTFNKFGWMENGFKSKELETAEFSLRVWLLGGKCALVPNVTLTQVMRNNFPLDDSEEKWEEDLYTLANLHFCKQRIKQCELLLPSGMSADSSAEFDERIQSSRTQYASSRRYDESWFLNQFGIHM